MGRILLAITVLFTTTFGAAWAQDPSGGDQSEESVEQIMERMRALALSDEMACEDEEDRRYIEDEFFGEEDLMDDLRRLDELSRELTREEERAREARTLEQAERLLRELEPLIREHCPELLSPHRTLSPEEQREEYDAALEELGEYIDELNESDAPRTIY